jgi:hypothetical protein
MSTRDSSLIDIHTNVSSPYNKNKHNKNELKIFGVGKDISMAQLNIQINTKTFDELILESEKKLLNSTRIGGINIKRAINVKDFKSHWIENNDE